MLRHLHDEYYDKFRETCDKYYKQKLTYYYTCIDETLHTITTAIDAKMTDLDQKLKTFDKTIKLSTPFQRHNRTPQKPTSSPIRSTNTPLKQFGAIKTEHATTPIQNFFHHHLKFEHQGDTYFYKIEIFLKTLQKLKSQ